MKMVQQSVMLQLLRFVVELIIEIIHVLLHLYIIDKSALHFGIITMQISYSILANFREYLVKMQQMTCAHCLDHNLL